MTSIIHEYINSHKTYIEKYGDKTIVLMQVGSFFELYMTNNEGPNLKDLSQLLNIICTKKDKSILEVSIKNPYMIGFPLVSSEKFITLLIQNGYTVVLIEQVTPPPDPKRKVTQIYSPSTYISSTPDTNNNFALCLYLEYESQKIKKSAITNSLLCVGLSAIDITTGKVIVDEGLSSVLDTEFGIDVALKFIQNIRPREVFIVKTDDNGKMNLETIIDYLQLDMKICKIKQFDKKYTKLQFQEEFLNNIYSSVKSNLSIIEALDLEHKIYGRVALIMLLDFLYEYSSKIIKNLSTPNSTENNKHLFLGNNAVTQLSVITHDESMYVSGTKFKCLYDVVCNAYTPMGKRYIKWILTNPLKNHTEIKEILNNVEYLKTNKFYKKFSDKLSMICDIEKIKRKCNLNILNPYEIADLADSIEIIPELLNLIRNTPLSILTFPKDVSSQLDRMIKYFRETFNRNELRKNILRDIKTNFFHKNVFPEIDEIVAQFNSEYDTLLEIKNKFDKILNQIKLERNKKYGKHKNNNEDIDTSLSKISNTKKEGYFLEMSLIRFESVKLYLNKLEKLNSTDADSVEIDSEDEETTETTDSEKVGESNKNNLSIDLSQFDIKILKSQIKLFLKKPEQVSSDKNDLTEIESKLIKMVEKIYIEQLKFLHDTYEGVFNKIISFVTYIDYIISNAITADLYAYQKPKITSSDSSYVKAQNLRHPIVERLIDYEYIPHSIELGSELKGILIYGLNSSGKSVLMKAVGLSVIMAQCGMYVPAKSFELTPYNSIYTRITGNDNLFKGLSSFSLEMVELNSIIKRADKMSLIIGDEVCRGTEHISGNAIVASTIVSLSESKSSFIFATHLHELIHLECIKKLNNVKAFHLSVDFDPKTDSLIYDRKLKEGSGDKVYGILVAKYIIQDKKFMELTVKIKNELTNNFDTLISGKTSRYNSNLYVYKCEICSKNNVRGDRLPLETHHINFQKDFIENKTDKENKEHLIKNSLANLIVICDECHNKIHTGELKIESKIITSKGKRVKVSS
jgi:DNA mismatch repair protein MutS